MAYPNSSLGQALQQALPSAKVVKTLNTLEAPLMVNPSAIGPSTVFLSGDDAEAKTTATQLLADPGWADDAIVDLGGIASARGPEHYFLLFAALWQALGTATFNDGDDQEKLGRLCPIRKAWLSGLEAASLVSRTTSRLR